MDGEQAKQVGLDKRKRDGKDPEVEEALSQWFATVLAESVSISGPILQAKAEEFTQNYPHGCQALHTASTAVLR